MTTNWRTKLAHPGPDLHVHLLGIGGAGLGPIAHMLLEMGVRISGSDRQRSANTDRLAQAGAQVYIGQVAANLTELPPAQRPDVVLISSAVAADNPERQAAVALGLPVVKRNDFLSTLLARRKVIAIAGAHGKSTTTAMIVKVLREGGIDAGYIIGANLPGYGNAAAGRDDYFVIEADEYDYMFLGLKPALAVITSVEWDHPDCYPTPESFHQAFAQFVALVQPDGLVVSCADDAGAEALRQGWTAERPTWLTYGLDELAHLRADDPQAEAGSGYGAELQLYNAPMGELKLRAPGLHNMRNALAAVAAGCWCGVPVTESSRILAEFGGVSRRFEIKGEVNGVVIIDDYAHNPTKIRAALAAARAYYAERRIWAVVQPHTFSRTKELLPQLVQSFGDADNVLVTDIFAARERDTGLINSAQVVAASPHPAIQHTPQLRDAVERLAHDVRPGDVVITLGAGDSYKIGEMLMQELRVSV